MDHEDHDADELEVVKVTSMPTPDTISSLLHLSTPSDCGANADHRTVGPSTDADADVAAEEVRLVRNDAMSLLGYDVATLQARATARARERLRLKGLSLVADKTGEEGGVDVDAKRDARGDGNPGCDIAVPDSKPKAVTGGRVLKLPSHSLPMEPEEVVSGSPPANLLDQARELASAHSEGDGGSDGGETCRPGMQRPTTANDQNAVSPCLQRPPSSGWQGRSYKKQKYVQWPQHSQPHVHYGVGVNAGLPPDDHCQHQRYPHAAGPPPHQPLQPSHHPYAHNYFGPREIHGTRTSPHIGAGGGLEGPRYAGNTDSMREQKRDDPSEEWRSKLKDSAHRAMDKLRGHYGTNNAPLSPTASPSHRGRMMNHSNPGHRETWYSNGVTRGGMVPVRAAPNSAFEYTNSKVKATATKHNNDFAPPHSSLPGKYTATGTEALQRRSVLLACLRGDATLPPRNTPEAAGMGGIAPVERQPEHHERTSRHEDWLPRTIAAPPPCHCPDPERGKEDKSREKHKTYPRSHEPLQDKKPKRPLTAYILFFRVERSRILGRPITLDAASKMIDESVTGKRRHRKSHGKIGFKEMSRVISTKWRRMDKEEKDVYYKQARKLVIAYDKEKLAWETARFEVQPPPPDPAEKKSAQPTVFTPTLPPTPAMELLKSPPDTVIANDKEKLAWETARLNYNPHPDEKKSVQPTASTPTLPPTPAMELPKPPPDTAQDEGLSHSRSVGDINHKGSAGAVVRICLNGTKQICLDGAKPVSVCLASSCSLGEDEDGIVRRKEGGVATSDADAQCPRPATAADFEPPH